jgi:hypothetical protein
MAAGTNLQQQNMQAHLNTLLSCSFQLMYPQEEADDDRSVDQDSAIGDLGSYTSVKEFKTNGPLLMRFGLRESVYTTISGLDETIEENGRTYHMYKDGST